MNCINLKKKFNNTLFCKKSKKQITLKDCSNCTYKEYKMQCCSLNYNKSQNYSTLRPKKTYKMKTKSKKLAKLEKNRFSVFTDNLDKCYLCPNKKDHLHEIFAGRNRQNSMKYGFVLPLCEKCHRLYQNDAVFNSFWHKKGQLAFKTNYPNLTFESIFRINYLD